MWQFNIGCGCVQKLIHSKFTLERGKELGGGGGGKKNNLHVHYEGLTSILLRGAEPRGGGGGVLQKKLGRGVRPAS